MMWEAGNASGLTTSPSGNAPFTICYMLRLPVSYEMAVVNCESLQMGVYVPMLRYNR